MVWRLTIKTHPIWGVARQNWQRRLMLLHIDLIVKNKNENKVGGDRGGGRERERNFKKVRLYGIIILYFG